ncbi:MAG: rod shape-determining protein MreC [Kiritimatiellae bacterium]|nr:rod shape-determining protein MreC [Kiritimatiellia bacterium]
MKFRNTGTIAVFALAAIGTVLAVSFRSVSAEAVYPVERVRQSFVRKVCSRISGMARGAAASAENVRLKREIAELALLRGELEKVEAENVRLREALGYVRRSPGAWLAAGVLSRKGGAAAARDTIRVDKGTLDGVAVGAVVVSPEGLIGRVDAVSPHTSEIALITDASVKVACEVETIDSVRPRGILLGGGEDMLVLGHLRNAEEIPARSRVLTSGLGGVFPKGLVVGTLLDVRKDGKGLASEGEVQPAVEFSALEDVFIRRGK